ncbi:hypothetical protein BGZ68_001804, partial [Mortierella alpina]
PGTPGSGPVSGSQYPGVAAQQQQPYAPPGGQAPYPPPGQPMYQQQQSPYQQPPQQPMYQAPPPAHEQSGEGGKQGPDWMKMAGGMAAGGLALAGAKKLFGSFTENKDRPAQAHHH